MCQQPGSKSGLQQAVAMAGHEAGHLHPAYDLRPSAHAGIRHRRLQNASACGLSGERAPTRSCSIALATLRLHSMANTNPKAPITNWLCKPHLPWPPPSPQAR